MSARIIYHLYIAGQGNIAPYQASSQQQSSRKFQAFQGTGHTLS